MGYDRAEICLKGHLISASSNYSNHFEFCTACGSKTINKCPKCNAYILGWPYDDETELSLRRYGEEFTIPAQCHNCGNPYPWTENNQKRLNALLLIDTVLTDEEKSILREHLPDLSVNDANTLTSAAIIKSISEKASKTTQSFIRNLVLSVAVDSAKKFFGL